MTIPKKYTPIFPRNNRFPLAEGIPENRLTGGASAAVKNTVAPNEVNDTSGDITRYVITVNFHEDSLTEINELNNHLTRSGFLLTLTDDEGNVHELGTNTFGFVSAQSADEIKALVAGLAKSALDKDVDITVATWEAWSKNAQ